MAKNDVKILAISNYYYPYISGVSEYEKQLCEAWVKHGFDVTVLTSNHDKLPKTEMINGVKVIRAPIICKISKGTVSLSFIFQAIKMAKKVDIVNLHLPMLEAGLLASFIDSKKLVTMFQCQINLDKGLINTFIKRVMDFSNSICLKKSNKIMVTTLDYAVHSRFAYKYKDKMLEARAPIKTWEETEIKKSIDKKRIGFCGRIVEEKGIDVLLQAYSMIREERKDICLLIGGDYKNVAGGSIYHKLKAYIEKYHIEDVTFLGKINETEMGKFYSSLDVFVLPSTNSLEAFGMVQVEAMLCGVPVVASDLYGVRTIVQNTGMGLVSKRGDAHDLAKCILQVLDNKECYVKDKKSIEAEYSTKHTVEIFESTFKEIINKREKTDEKHNRKNK